MLGILDAASSVLGKAGGGGLGGGGETSSATATATQSFASGGMTITQGSIPQWVWIVVAAAALAYMLRQQRIL